MCSTNPEEIGEVLNAIFEKCEKDAQGFVEIRRLLHVLSEEYGASGDITETLECTLKDAGLVEKVNKTELESCILFSTMCNNNCLKALSMNDNDSPQVLRSQGAISGRRINFECSWNLPSPTPSEVSEISFCHPLSASALSSPGRGSETELPFLKGSITNLKDKLHKSESIISLLEEQVTEKLAENDALKKNNERLIEEVNRLKGADEKTLEALSSLSNVQVKYERALQDLNRFRRKITNLESDLLSRDDEVKDLQDEVMKKSVLAEERGKDNLVLSSELEAVSIENTRNYQLVEELKSQLENERETTRNLVERIRELSNEKVELQMQLNEASAYEHVMMSHSSTSADVYPANISHNLFEDSPSPQSLLEELSIVEATSGFPCNQLFSDDCSTEDSNSTQASSSTRRVATQTEICGTGWAFCIVNESMNDEERSIDRLHSTSLETAYLRSYHDRFQKKLFMVAILGGILLAILHLIISYSRGSCWYSSFPRTHPRPPPI